MIDESWVPVLFIDDEPITLGKLREDTIKQLANDNAIVDMWYKRFRGCQYPMITLQEALIGMVIGLNGEIKQKEGAKCP
jgi:hypothetical protein